MNNKFAAAAYGIAESLAIIFTIVGLIIGICIVSDALFGFWGGLLIFTIICFVGNKLLEHYGKQ